MYDNNASIKKSIVLSLLLLCLFLISCKVKLNKDNPYDFKMPRVQISNTQEELYQEPRVYIPSVELVYTNEEAGYRITFPKNWQGSYVITEYGPDEVCIGFYGKSQTGRIANKRRLKRDGLDIGWVVTDEVVEGSVVVGKLGKVNRKEYFLTTARGGTFLPYFEEISNSDSTMRSTLDYEVDEEELLLAEQDLKIAVQMRDDLYNMNLKFEALSK